MISRLKHHAGQLNLLGRPLGVELEYSSIIKFKRQISQYVNFGHWEHDGTLTVGGEELVLVAASGDVWLQNMTTIIGLQQQFQPQVDASCGFHVHVQSQDLSMIDVRRLIAMWCRVERQVFGSLVDAARRNGRPDGHHYCRPMMVDENERVESWQFIDKDVMRLMRKRLLEVNEQSTSMPEERIKSALMKKLYNLEWAVEAPKVPPMPLRGDPQFVAKQSAWRVAYCAAEKYQQTIYKFENIKANKRTNGGGSGCRYGAMNMHSHFYRGTVEFRLKEGTLEASEMIFWPLFCGWFVESCLHCSDAEALALDGLGGWVALMREKSLVQPSVLDWVEGKVKKC